MNTMNAGRLNPVDRLFAILIEEGGKRYGDEAVSQLQHALQCATLARDQGAGDSLITAALLHDIGHLLDEADEALARQGVDARHERRGRIFLSNWFDAAVTEPIALHVEAKRYLCWARSDYIETLSPASIQSLEVQGGPFNAEQAATFLALPYAEDAIRLRRCDEMAKSPSARTPQLEAFRRSVEVCLQRHHDGRAVR